MKWAEKSKFMFNVLFSLFKKKIIIFISRLKKQANHPLKEFNSLKYIF